MNLKLIDIKLAYLIVVFCMVLVGPAPAQESQIGLEDLIVMLKQEIKLAQSTDADLPRLEIIQVVLIANVAYSAAGGASINLPALPVSFDGSVSQQRTSKMTLTLKPADAGSIVGGISGLGLANAVRAAKSAIRAAYNSPPKFSLEQFDFEVSFVIKKEAGAGFKFIVFDVLKGDVSNEYIQKINISMKIAE